MAYQLAISEIGELTTDGFEGGLITDDIRSVGGILVRKGATISHELSHFLLPFHKPVKAAEFLCSREAMRLWTATEQDRYARMEVTDVRGKSRCPRINRDDYSVLVVNMSGAMLKPETLEVTVDRRAGMTVPGGPASATGSKEPVRPQSPASRIVSAGLEASLERFNDPQLLAEGKVNVISLEAVQERLGERWAFKRDQVYGFTDRVLERGVGAGGVYLRVSDTDFFIAQPDLGRMAGQAACLRYLREVLNHFLGDDQMASASVLQVTRIAGGRLEAQPLDMGVTSAQPDVVPRNRPSDGQESTGEAKLPDETLATLQPEPVLDEPATDALSRWTPFVCNDGRLLKVSATLEPVYELKSFTRIGFRMIRRVIVVQTEEELPPQRIALLSAADLLRVDVATILRGIDRLTANRDTEGPLSLIVPVSFVSLSSQRSRTELVKHLKAAGGLVKMGVICEICDIEGVPPGMLLAAASLVRPFTVLTVGRLLAPTPASVRYLAGSGLQALSFDCPPGLGDAEFVRWAAAAIGSAKLMGKSVVVYGASAARASALASLGATHASLAA